ncbi:unnamed protein product, partial [Haemonchus placei]|uniref:ERAP1_C domain-containing protein n=1 Tax=Haemonchus placei TaxID=6290 RepID=A0A0N4VZS9_HAEPC
KPLYLHVSNPDTSIVVNADRHGFYRQNYDAKGWRKIIKQLKKNHKAYSARTRNAIIGDAFAAALIDELEYATVFKLLEYAKNEEVFFESHSTVINRVFTDVYFGLSRNICHGQRQYLVFMPS